MPDSEGQSFDVSVLTRLRILSSYINRTLATLVTRCTKSEGTRNYFDIGVIGYGGSDTRNGFQGALNSSILNSISDIEASPLKIEDRKKKMDDGAGGIIEQSSKFPIWFEPTASGGTPMCKAIMAAAEQAAAWCDAHPDCYPPTVLHITDGESTDGNPEELASQLRQIRTNDGEVLLFNLHVSSFGGTDVIKFPASETSLPGCVVGDS